MNQPSVATRIPADKEAVAARCKNTADTKLAKKLCLVKEEYKFQHWVSIKECRKGCSDDKLCRDRCFYSKLNIPDEDLNDKFRMTHFINKCKHSANVDACLSELLDIDTQALTDANQCSDSKCVREVDYRSLFMCTLECQKDLIENVKEISIEELAKDTVIFGPDDFKTSQAARAKLPSLLTCSFVTMLILSQIY
ncbi:hypothetical protein DSO57_1023471 [Entomophthora muscae]|uniref:Uncharacterized protein n=1 Tax=Entomophthora muscae TaxID=34485 RepID=A0ACC2TQE3_9FUNG|nr:hypothetical protein DSO57_1023471 [Entomophthora muscae]